MVAVQTVKRFERVKDLFALGDFLGVPWKARKRSSAIGASVAALLRVVDVRAEQFGPFCIGEKGETGLTLRADRLRQLVARGLTSLADDERDLGRRQRSKLGEPKGDLVLANGTCERNRMGGLDGLGGARLRRRGFSLRAKASPRKNEHDERAGGREQNGN